EVGERRRVLEERLLDRLPRERERGERGPLVVRRELRRAVGADRRGEQVAVEQRVVHAAEPRRELRGGEPRVRELRLRAVLQHVRAEDVVRETLHLLRLPGALVVLP